MDGVKKKKTLSQLLGVPELVVAMFPILVAYPNYIGIIAMSIIALYFGAKRKSIYWYRPLLFYIIFYIVHEILLLFLLPEIPGYFINRTIMTTISLLLVLIIAPNLRYEKMYNSLILVSIICIIGLLYHLFIVITGGIVSTIQIPLLPKVAPSYLIEGDGLERPCSFFIEPAAFAAFMMAPLAWSLIKNKMVMAVIISVAVLLSTSTNGYAFTAIIWIVFLITQNQISLTKKIMFVGLVAILFYWGMGKGFFDIGLAKINNTNYSDDVRLTSGLNLYKDIPFIYKITGIDAANVYDFLAQNPGIIQGNYVISISARGVYLTTFWDQAIKFGFMGVFLYLYCYLGFWEEKRLRPYIVVCLVSLFSQSGSFVFPMIIMIVLRTTLSTELKFLSPQKHQ